MNYLKTFLANLMLNKKQLITVFLVGIAVLAIPVSLQLVQKQQIIKSRASGGDDSMYNTSRGPKTLGQMKSELVRAQFAGPGQRTVDALAKLTPFQIFKAYMQAGPYPVFACAVNAAGDPDNMPTQLKIPEVGQELRVMIARKLQDKRCNQWFATPRITNLTTGKVYGDYGDDDNPNRVCRNGRNPKLAPGVPHQEYEGAGAWFDSNNWEQSANDCFFEPVEPGNYKADIFYFRDNNCGPAPLEASCTFKVVPAGQGGSGSGPTPTPTPTPSPSSSNPTPTPTPTPPNDRHPTSTLFGPTFAKVNQRLNYTLIAISFLDGVSSSNIWITKDTGNNTHTRVTANDVEGYNESNFNCDNVSSPNCAFYKIANSTSVLYSGNVTLKTAGNYIIVNDVVPGGDNNRARACSSNPHTTYPVTTGGYTFYKCGEPINLRVIP